MGLYIKWFNGFGTVKIGECIVTITISTKGIYGHYVGYRVKISGKNNVLDTRFFTFKYYLGSDYEIIDHACLNGIAKWCNSIPCSNSVAAMAKTIADYINVFKE